MTCDNGTCTAPPGYVTPTYSYEPPTSSTSSTSNTPYVPPTYGPGASRTVTPTYSNPYGPSITITIPSYTIPIYADATSPPESTCSGGGGGDSSSSNSNGNIGINNNTATIVGSVLGAFSTFISGLAAWFYKKKNDAEKALAAVLKPTPPPVEEPKPKPEPPKAERPAYVGNENSYVERPITGSPAIAGHGNNYT